MQCFFSLYSCICAPIILAASEANINWQQFAGTTLNIMLCRHPWQETIEPYFPEFEQLTGMKIVTTILPEAEYLTKKFQQI